MMKIYVKYMLDNCNCLTKLVDCVIIIKRNGHQTIPRYILCRKGNYPIYPITTYLGDK